MSPRTTARRARTPLVEIDKAVHEFLYNWGVAKDAGNLRDNAKKTIKAWFDRDGDPQHDITQNETGSLQYEFDSVVEIGGRKFRGIENRLTASRQLDLDKVDEYLDSLPPAGRDELSKKLYKKVTEYVFQPDELYKLNQEGVIDDDTLEDLYTTTETWALNVLNA